MISNRNALTLTNQHLGAHFFLGTVYYSIQLVIAKVMSTQRVLDVAIKE